MELYKQNIENYLELKSMKDSKARCDLIKIKTNLNVNFKITDDGITPLMLACTSGDVEIVKLILCNPTLNINQVDH